MLKKKKQKMNPKEGPEIQKKQWQPRKPLKQKTSKNSLLQENNLRTNI